MTLRIEESIDDRKRQRGQELHEILNELSDEHKKALVWFRCNEGEIPSDIDLDNDAEYARIEATLNALGNFGPVYVNEYDFVDIINELYEEYDEILEDGEAWDVLTRIEIANFESYEGHHFEAYIYENDIQRNDVGIDLVGEERMLELVTCKYDISTQHAAACRRLSELKEVKDTLDENSLIGLGTLAFKLESAIVGDLSQHMSDFEFSEEEIDKIVTGIDIFDLTR